MPVILDMEQRGVNLDVPLLAADTKLYSERLEALDESIYEQLGQRISVDSGAELADALERVGLASGFRTTATGKRSVAKDSLFEAIHDKQLLGTLLVRGALATCLRTFMGPWLEQGQKHQRLYLRWNQIRNYTDTGARTGRLSSSPNLQNIPTNWELLLGRLAAVGYEMPWEMPQVRKYIIPDPGHTFIGRDYSAQEMRLLAHFAGGALLESIQKDPTSDVHQIAARIASISRKEAKTLGFAVLYGAGVGRIAESLKIGVSEATGIKARYLKALPEIKQFASRLSEDSKCGRPVLTLAGRQYYAERPKVINGIFKSFEYKLTNYKIQGSAADQTKEAMYRYASSTTQGQLVLSVHDQLVIQVPTEHVQTEREVLREAVNGSYQDILKYRVLSDEAIATNFGDLK